MMTYQVNPHHERVERGGEYRSDVQHVGKSGIGDQREAGQQFHDHENPYGHDAFSPLQHQYDQRDAHADGQRSVRDARSGRERDGGAVGVAAQQADYDRQASDAQCSGSEELLALQHGF